MKNAGRYKGFTLIETIAAAVLLSLAVVTLCTISTRSVVGIKKNRGYELAWEVLNRQLTFIDYIGVETFLEQGQFSGEIGDEETGTVHRWQVDVTEGGYEGLYRVDIAVGWGPDRGRRTISASTYLNSDTGQMEAGLTDTQLQ